MKKLMICLMSAAVIGYAAHAEEPVRNDSSSLFRKESFITAIGHSIKKGLYTLKDYSFILVPIIMVPVVYIAVSSIEGEGFGGTHFVHGYYRKDGTYVNGYYRH